MLFVAAYSNNSEWSVPLTIFTALLFVVGLGCDLWVRSSPARPAPVVHAPKHPRVLKAVFFGTMVALFAALIHFDFFLDPPWSWRRKTFSIAFPLIFLLSYNLLIAYVRQVRRQNLTSN
jgi:ABC-type sulfate transport system permease component